MLYPTPIAKLIDSFSKLPGIGIKTATRLAFYTIGMSDDDVNEFAKTLLAAKRELTYCCYGKYSRIPWFVPCFAGIDFSYEWYWTRRHQSEKSHYTVDG